MYSISTFLKDVYIQVNIRAKIFIKDKMAVVVYVSAFAIFAVIFGSLNKQAEERSSIPIGIVNYDYEDGEASEYSLELINNLKSLPSLYVYEGEINELIEKLISGKINSLYVIEQGYAKKLKKGDNKNLMTVYHSSKSNFAFLVTDITAGEMVYQACIERSFIKYRKYAKNYENWHTEKEYMEYARKIKESDDIDFGFFVSYIENDSFNNNTENIDNNTKNIDNSILYRQIIAGIATMVFSFVILFVMTQNVIERGNDIYKRRRITLINRASTLTADVISSLIILSFLIIVFSAGFSYYEAKITFAKSACLSVGFGLIMGFIFAILGRLIKNMFWFQVTGSLMIIGFGIISLLSILKGFGVLDVSILADMLQNTWFINMVTKALL